MEVKSAIEKRRSVRKHQDKEVSDDLISELIESARLAPSAYNAQPTKFVIVKEKKPKRFNSLKINFMEELEKL